MLGLVGLFAQAIYSHIHNNPGNGGNNRAACLSTDLECLSWNHIQSIIIKFTIQDFAKCYQRGGFYQRTSYN